AAGNRGATAATSEQKEKRRTGRSTPARSAGFISARARDLQAIIDRHARANRHARGSDQAFNHATGERAANTRNARVDSRAAGQVFRKKVMIAPPTFSG